jgi:hypothetical protein
MGSDKDGCSHCPLVDDSQRENNSLCLAASPYPFTLVEKSLKLEIEISNEGELVHGFTSFTQEVFASLGKPNTTLHPRAFLRATVDGRRKGICPYSWPTPRWASLMIEQIQFDTSGMAPRLLYNDRPWLAQPAIYTQVFAIVSRAKKVADDWLEIQKKSAGK